MVQHLRESGVDASQIVEMNFESMQFREMTVQNLYQYVKDRLPDAKRAYLFFDEIQRVDQWQDAVNSFRVDFDCDIYVTGSNVYLLSSEYATYLTGRSVEIQDAAPLLPGVSGLSWLCGRGAAKPCRWDAQTHPGR